MRLSPFRSVFSKLFASVMLALILFAIAMVFLTKVLQDNNNSIRSEILAAQVVDQINPFLYDLNTAPNRLQSRFMLAVIKKSLDIFDQSLDAKMGLYDTSGRLLVQTDGSDLPKTLPQPPSWFAKTFPTLAGVTPTANARVFSPAGYTIFFEPRRSPEYNALTAMFNLFTGTLLLLVIMALALWWIAHSMTWRINQLSKQMQQLGEGDFGARVTVSGNDEITTLAKGFNQSAEKIEKLISANNLLLAHASHEIRTPITRIRLQVEMMDMIASHLSIDKKQKFDKRASAINRDLTGLNDLVESILLVSRLDAGHVSQKSQKMDLYDLIYQEIQHFPKAKLFGEHVIIHGQSKLLTHLIRNLLNNAMIHGTAPISVFVYGTNLKEAEDIPLNLVAESKQQLPAMDFLENPKYSYDNDLSTEQTEKDSITTIKVKSKSEKRRSISPTVRNSLNKILELEKLKLKRKDNLNIDDSADNSQKSNNESNIDVDKENSQNNSNEVKVKETITSSKKTIYTSSKRQTNDDKNEQSSSDLVEESASSLPVIITEPNVSSLDTPLTLRNRAERFTRNSFTIKPKPKNIKSYDYIAIAVVDKGKGIPVEKREDIFSPFVRLKQEKKGSGLGLSLVAQIVESHNGSIITDTWQGNTRFLVVLPVKHLINKP